MMWNYSCRYATPAFSSGISASSTSTLTPTTLSNLEQTFIELQSVPSRTMQNPITQSGFVPPIVHSALQSDNDLYSDSSSNLSADDYLPSAPKKVKIGDKTTTIMSKYEIENPQRKTHRRQIREDEISPEEAARRNLRRERNKVAAAKCRQRRVDHTNRLLNETDKLEAEGQAIEQEIQALQQEKDQLEFILQAHNPICKINGSHPNSSHLSVKVKRELERDQPQNLTVSTSSESKKEVPAFTSRPSSLSLLKRDLKSELVSAGVSITTPSSGFYSITLDTMVDHTGLTPLTGSLGHTGLTPITSMPQSCSSEVTKKQSTSSESSDGMKSPSNLITL
ncbi:fos-related antigen 1-like isoform X2 [Mercenaria mercenaria]|uniref:fos-related antigen 1-like isoform X2 n=1 Tax=Mercenaria mercenaria TaxID=6596 RepID=UPI001E1DFBB6|nr:fos-related antigen 1-like isoform X2 [Mercenaria mercenaria]